MDGHNYCIHICTSSQVLFDGLNVSVFGSDMNGIFCTAFAAVFAEDVNRPSATGKIASVVLRLTDQGKSAGMIPV